MSREDWAAIVYGRSFHLDFRFITIPHDFASEDIAWASQHILATTHQARHLASHARWSLFKNDSHCIVGVTCMVRDLIGQLGEESLEVMAKDDRGRPLYVFVGYVTQLRQKKSLHYFPAYTEKHLTAFKPLYQHIEKVWLVKDYEENSRHPLQSQYEGLNSAVELISTEANVSQSIKLNNQKKRPNKIFLWSNSPQRNHELWIAAAKCSTATSVCLDIKGKFAVDSPFLNQSTTQIDEFTICDRLTTEQKNHQSYIKQKQESKKQKLKATQPYSSLSEKISHRAKEDIGITLEQAAKVATVGQELINHFGDPQARRESDLANSHQPSTQKLDSELDEVENFGFKTKKSQPLAQNQDWF